MQTVKTVFVACALGIAATLAAACDSSRPTYTLNELSDRTLTTEVRPWYVFHGLLAHGKDLTLELRASGASVAAVDFVTMQQFGLDDEGKPLALLYVEDGLPQFTRTPGDYFSQGHPNQFLSILIDVGVPLSQRVDLGNGTVFTLADMLEKAKRDIRPSLIGSYDTRGDFHEHELAWSTPLFANALGADATWKNKWDEDVSVEALIEISLERNVGWGSCAGTHELYGLARALKKYRTTHSELSGVWARLAAYLEDAKSRARQAQRPGGWFADDWDQSQAGPLESEDTSDNNKVYVTGHMLEWLVLVSTPDELDQPLLRSAYEFLRRSRFTSVMLERGHVPEGIVSYGPLAHALHGMRLYEEALRIRHSAGETDRRLGLVVPFGHAPIWKVSRSTRRAARSRNRRRESMQAFECRRRRAHRADGSRLLPRTRR